MLAHPRPGRKIGYCKYSNYFLYNNYLTTFFMGIDVNNLKRNILNDMRVELVEEFDRNFERKAFFTRKWKPRRINRRGSLLIVSGALRDSIKAVVKGNGVAFTSNVPYAVAHNEGLPVLCQ